MNLLCPNCQKPLTVPDQFAGTQMQCPLCEGKFAVPALPTLATIVPVGAPTTESSAAAAAAPAGGEVYGVEPLPAKPTPPPRPEPPAPRPEPEPRSREENRRPAPPPASPPPAGYDRRYTIWISPRVVTWIAPGALAVLFVMMFFPWVGAYKEITDAAPMTQTGWGTAFGRQWTVAGLLHVLALLLTMILAATEVAVPLAGLMLPSWAEKVWPYRSALVTAAALIAFLLLATQVLSGFGLEQAIETGDANKLARMTLFRTNWLRLAFVCYLIALAGLALDSYLQRRGNRPIPRVDVAW
jgi:hypothetical protein